MTLDCIKSYSYTSSAAIMAAMTVNHCSGTGTLTAHQTPYMFLLGNSYSIIQETILTEDQELTMMCMMASEKSLAEDWNNEDDDRWNKFLIND